MTSYIPKKEILEQTNGGFDVIKHYYPNASTNKNFVAWRKEKKPSARLYKNNNIYYVVDFGGETRNAIEIVMEENNMDYHHALILINEKFCSGAVNGNDLLVRPKPIYESVNKQTVSFEFKEAITNKELKFLGKDLKRETCEKYNLKSVVSCISSGKKSDKHSHKFSSTEEYPIFCYDFGTWQKLYQPFADKKYKYLHFGKKPKDFIFGMQMIKEKHNNKRNDIEEQIRLDIEELDHSEEEIQEMIEKEFAKDLTDVIICSGEKDVINIAQLGYNAVCLNSESATLTKEQYKQLKFLSKDIYNIPDIDKTGIKMGNKMALEYIDIKTIWLDERLRSKRDFRGKSCKDVTDFLKHFDSDFFQILKNVSTPLMFWKKKKETYSFNSVIFCKFLNTNGFHRYINKNNEFGYIYLRIKNKIVEKIEPSKIRSKVKDFVNNYVRYKDIELQEKIYRTTITNESSLMNMTIRANEFDFKNFNEDYQYLFFNKKAWKITKNKIEQLNIKDIDKYIWNYDIKDRCKNPKLLKKPIFEVNYSEEYKKNKSCKQLDKYEIKINDNDFSFMKFVENTSKIYWKKDVISEDNKKEQNLHLLNKLSAFGYLAYKFKQESKAWAVIGMDAKDSEIGKSYGGSGKSLFFKSLKYISNVKTIDGKKDFDKDHIFEGTTEYTEIVNVDDTKKNLKFKNFFSRVTGDFNVNPKGKSNYDIPFEISPKIAIATNFVMKNDGDSSIRRQFLVSFSDYYHIKTENNSYEKTVSPREEFGKDFFLNNNEDEWNKFYNFASSCIQVYMKYGKIDPPMEDIQKRNARYEIGESFISWADDYFIGTKFHSEISKNELFESFKNSLSKREQGWQKISKFKKKMQLYCNYKDYIFNPEEKRNNSGRIMRNDGEYFEIHEKKL